MKGLLKEIEWAESLSPLNINEAWKYFSEQFNNILQDCFPLFANITEKILAKLCSRFQITVISSLDFDFKV